LERDRAAVLTRKAATLGVIDYRQADWHNPSWWKHWRYLVNAIDKQDDEKLLELAFKYQLALISNSSISADDFSKLQKSGKNIFKEIESTTRPWIEELRKAQQEDEITSFKETWKNLVGFSLDDPEAKAEWERKVEESFEESRIAFEKEQRAAEEERLAFARRLAEIKEKRRKQQGRRA
jgi:hypothetical protein